MDFERINFIFVICEKISTPPVVSNLYAVKPIIGKLRRNFLEIVLLLLSCGEILVLNLFELHALSHSIAVKTEAKLYYYAAPCSRSGAAIAVL